MKVTLKNVPRKSEKHDPKMFALKILMLHQFHELITKKRSLYARKENLKMFEIYGKLKS